MNPLVEMNPFIRREIDIKAARFYDKHYEILDYSLLNFDDFVMLGNEHHQVCRFCGRVKSPENKFEKIAHAFPESIGNRYLATYYECDKCNTQFGKTIESEFANFMKFYHSISKIHGKKKIPIFISNDNKSKSLWENDTFVLVDSIDNFHTKIIDNKITYQATAPTHVPMAVYKCFVKMALSVMPEKELSCFKDTIEWILDKNHKNIFGIKKLVCRYVMIPGFNTTKYPCYILYKRKGSKSLSVLPYMIFNITYGNFSYMIEVPTVEDINQDITSIKFPPIPFYISGKGTFDLTSPYPISDFSQSMTWTIDTAHEISVEDIPENIIKRVLNN